MKGIQNNRLAHIDIAKGIAILCMILGHLYVCHDVRWMNPFIYTWHMPLFFFLSGCFLRVDENWGSFTVRRIRRLIVPYVTFGLLGFSMSLSALRIEPVWLMLTAFPIIGFVLWLSNQVVSSPLEKPLLWMGKNSLGILCAHHLYLSGMGYSVCSSIVHKVGISHGGRF